MTIVALMLAGLCGWLLYDRHQTRRELAVVHRKLNALMRAVTSLPPIQEMRRRYEPRKPKR